MVSFYLSILLMLLGAQTLVWLLSVRKRDASIVDIFWGFGFVMVAWACLLFGDGLSERRWLLAALTSIWGLRLTLYLAMRNLGKPEDYRYQAMRRQHGANFPLRSLFIVFWFQGLVAWLVSFPLQAAANSTAPLSGLDWAGVLLWIIGVLFESIGDAQLSRFKADPSNAGKVMRSGLWRYTRHPNYFGDFMVWWGFGCIALSAGAVWSIIGPILMSFFLLWVSGVALLEKTITRRRPEYEEYIKQTSAFFPWPPTD
jgi:steroid 5-alpha reductase family enzyme